MVFSHWPVVLKCFFLCQASPTKTLQWLIKYYIAKKTNLQQLIVRVRLKNVIPKSLNDAYLYLHVIVKIMWHVMEFFSLSVFFFRKKNEAMFTLPASLLKKL